MAAHANGRRDSARPTNTQAMVRIDDNADSDGVALTGVEREVLAAAERDMLGAMMLGRDSVAEVLDMNLEPSWHFAVKHEYICDVIYTLYGNGKRPNAITVAAELDRRGQLVQVGGLSYLQALAGSATTAASAGHYAEIVRTAYLKRRLHINADRTHQVARVTEADQLLDAAVRQRDELDALVRQIKGATDGASELSRLLVPGGSFVLDVPETPPAVWGRDGDVLWAEGEALLLNGPQGVGKTTVASQLARARLGLQSEVLGFPVTSGVRRLLYLAMDRPAQARRAMARLFAKDPRAVLDERLIVWQGPPPDDMAQDTGLLARMCREADADTVIVDSLKDAAIGLSEDRPGAAYNRARQLALADGVQVLELHHPVKRGANGGEPNTIADIYGSTWLTSGCGSVISLYGAPGDPIVSFRHLKQPMNEVGPFKVTHDHAAGTSEVSHGRDLLDLVRAGGAEGLTAKNAAAVLFETTAPTPAQVEKARRRMEKLRADGILVRFDAAPNSGAPTTYFLGEREAL